jgi:hypothetical protein
VEPPWATRFLALNQQNSTARTPPPPSTPQFVPTAAPRVVSSPVELLFDQLLRRRLGSVVRLLAQVLWHAHDSLWVVPLLVVHYAAPRSRVRCLRSVVGLPVALAIRRLSRQLRYAPLHSRRPHALLLHTGQHSSPAISRETDENLHLAVTAVRCPQTTQLAMTTAMMTAA